MTEHTPNTFSERNIISNNFSAFDDSSKTNNPFEFDVFASINKITTIFNYDVFAVSEHTDKNPFQQINQDVSKDIQSKRNLLGPCYF
jgi:hypothetical protein